MARGHGGKRPPGGDPRKRASTRPTRPTRPTHGARGPGSTGPGPEGLIRQAEAALDADHPLDLLALASSLVMTLRPRRLLLRQDESRGDLPSVRDLMGAFAESGLPPMQALAWAMAQLDDDELSRRTITRQIDARVLPAWLAGLDRAEVVGAWQTTDVLRDGSNVVLSLRIGGRDLTLVGFMDFTMGGLLKDGFAVPMSLSEFQAKWREIAEPEDAVEQIDLSPADARAWLAEAIDIGEHTFPSAETDSWPQAQPLFEWALRRCPPGGRGRPDVGGVEVSVEEIVAEATRVVPGLAALDSDDMLGVLLDMIVNYAWADPLLLSPTKVETLLLDLIPRKLWAPVDMLRPIPALLRVFIPYAHRQRNIPPAETARTIDAVDRYEPAYLAALAVRGAGPGFGWGSLRTPRDLMLAAVGGEDALEALDDAPLPDEPLDLNGVADDIRDRVRAVAGLADGACDALFDVETRTAVRRFLHDVAVANPDLFRRRSRDDIGAAAACWQVGSVNHSIVGGGGVSVGALNAHFGISGSVSQRAGTMRRALTGRDTGSTELGSPRYLTSVRRAALIRSRDRS